MDSEFTCNNSNCNQKFQSVYTYKRHSKLTHVKMRSVEHNPKRQKIDIPSTVNKDSDEDFSSEDDQNINNLVSNISNIFNVNSQDICHKQFAKITMYEVPKIVAKLYAKSKLNRTTVHEVIITIVDFYGSTCINIIKKNYEHINGLSLMLSIIKDSFAKFKTEHLSFQYFIQKGTLILPNEIPIVANLNSRSRSFGGVCKSVQIDHDIQNVLIKKVLQKFLELPGVLESIVANVERLKNSRNLDSLFTGEFYKSIAANYNENELLLPFMFYNDDLEINNALGSRKGVHKMGNVYYSIMNTQAS